MSDNNELKKISFFRKLYLMLKKTFFRFIENQGFIIANGLALKTIIALIPAMIILALTLRLLPVFNEIKGNFLELLQNYIVPKSFDLVVAWIEKTIENTRTISIISIFVFIYLSIDLLITLDIHVEKIWGIRGNRTITQKILKYWALVSITPFVLGGYFYYSGLIRTILVKQFINNTSMEEFIFTLISFTLLSAFFFLAYFIIPNSRVHIIKAIIVSSIISAVWIVLREIFAYYSILSFSRLSIFYGSFAVLIIFVIWTATNWIVLLFGIEFLCVWQNKLYLGSLVFKESFLFDVGIILSILNDFYSDFMENGNGLTVKELLKEYKHNPSDIVRLIRILVNEAYIVSDNNNKEERYYLRRNISSIKLSDIESLVWSRLKEFDISNSGKLQGICEKLGKYYYKHQDQSVIYLNDIISSI